MHKEVLMFGGQEVETKRFDKVSNKMRLQGMKMVSASSISDPIIQLIVLPGAGLCPAGASASRA
ncbi:hypothetical protein MJ524_10390 [Escherichia coli]|nr:hypothetical protein MJ524_10390 [Escherichia coli]